MEAEYDHNTVAYLNVTERHNIVWELLVYAYNLYNRVYVFKNFEAFSKSFDFNGENPPKEYWEGLSNEALIDNVKICAAFENYNKAILLSKGFIVHNIDRRKNALLAKEQQLKPVLIKDFLLTNSFAPTASEGELYLQGFNGFTTISFSRTLSPAYQNVIGLEERFVHYLAGVNSDRNRLHFHKNYPGARNVRLYLDSIKYARDYGTFQLNSQIQNIERILDSISK